MQQRVAIACWRPHPFYPTKKRSYFWSPAGEDPRETVPEGGSKPAPLPSLSAARTQPGLLARITQRTPRDEPSHASCLEGDETARKRGNETGKKKKELLFDEPIRRAGRETQTQRADLRTQWGRTRCRRHACSQESPLQHRSSEASGPRRSAFFMVQLSHAHVTTRKTTALTRQTFVGKVMSLLFNTLSRFVIDFLPRTLKSPLDCKEIKPVNSKGNQP